MSAQGGHRPPLQVQLILFLSLDLTDGIGGFSLGLVIRPGHHLAEETDGHELDAADNQKHRDKQQRAMFLHDLDVLNQLLVDEKQAGPGSEGAAQKTPAAEKLKRLG